MDKTQPLPPWWRKHSEAPSLLEHVEAVVAGPLRYETFLTWLDKTGRERASVAFGDFWKRAEAVACALQAQQGVAQAERVLLCFAPAWSFYVVFWACLRAGVVAVPVYPPDPSKLAKAIDKLRLVADACDARLCLCDDDVALLRRTKGLFFEWPAQLTWWNVQHLTTRERKGGPMPLPLVKTDVAFIQFTSGSTGDPKGVMVGHGNLWHNVNEIIIPYDVEAARRAGGSGERWTAVSWLPQYHDLGLVYAHVARLCHGDHAVYMSPLTFIAKPTLWLDAASRYRAQLLVAPDFGYRLLAKRVRDMSAGSASWDLRSIVWCTTAAERVREETYVELFEVLEPYGFREAIIIPAYGLAESVVGVVAMVVNQRAAATSPPPRRDVAVSSPDTCLVTIKIVDPDTRRPVAAGETGEIFVSSPSVALGYWGRPELSDEVFRARLEPDDGRTYLRTGDAGYFDDDGLLYICARLKDLLILNGRNFFADDIEAVVQDSDSAVRPGCLAAFSCDDFDDAAVGMTEGLVVVFEVRTERRGDAAEVTAAIFEAVAVDVGIRPRRVVAIEERTIPKTTSGKIRRRATRASLDAGKLKVVFDSANPDAALGRRDGSPSEDPTSIVGWFKCVTSEMLYGGPAVEPEREREEPTSVGEEVVKASKAAPAARLDERQRVQLATGSWVTDVEKAVRAADEKQEDPSRLLDRIRFVSDFGEDDDRVGERARDILIAGEVDEGDVARAVQLAFIETALEASIAALRRKQPVDRRVSLATFGMTSMEASQLVHDLSSRLNVDVDMELLLQPDLPTSSIAVEILNVATADATTKQSLSSENLKTTRTFASLVALPDGADLGSAQLAVWLVAVLQAIGVLVVALAVAIPLIPCYHFGLWAMWTKRHLRPGHDAVFVPRDNPPFSHVKFHRDVDGYGILAPLLIPMFMSGLAAVTIVMKWLVVGRYRSGTIHRRSAAYVRWWLVDRVMDQFERWCGVYIAETLFATLFYKLCGAHVAWSSVVGSSLREFDLVDVGAFTSIKGSTYARIFVSDGQLQFAPVAFERGCATRGGSAVMPGTVVGEFALLDRLSAAPHGARLEAHRKYQGSPARDVDGIDNNDKKERSWFRVEVFKLTALSVLLYVPFTLANFGTACLLELVDWDDWATYHYRPQLRWILGFFLSMIVVCALCVTFKRSFVAASPRPPKQRSDVEKALYWAIEFMWYRLVCGAGGVIFSENGLISPLLWRACGASVPLSVLNLNLTCISPIEASLFTFGPNVTMPGAVLTAETDDGTTYLPVEIGAQAQVGLRSVVRAGCRLEPKSVVAQMTALPERSVVPTGKIAYGTVPAPAYLGADDEHKASFENTKWRREVPFLFSTVIVRPIMLASIVLALVPAYELAWRTLYGGAHFYKSEAYDRGIKSFRRTPMDRNVAVLLMGPIYFVATACFTALLRLYSKVFVDPVVKWRAKSPTKEDTYASFFWAMSIQPAYFRFTIACHTLFLDFVRGSVFAVWYMRAWGARVDASALINHRHFFEGPLLDVRANAVIDVGNSQTGHVYSHGKLTFATSTISPDAIVHPNGIVWAGDLIPTAAHVGPITHVGANAPASGVYLQGSPVRRYDLHHEHRAAEPC